MPLSVQNQNKIRLESNHYNQLKIDFNQTFHLAHSDLHYYKEQIDLYLERCTLKD